MDMAVNKVCIGDETIIDLSTDSLETSDQVANGVTAHNRFGEQLTGTGGDPLYDYPIGGSYCDNTATGFHLADGITNIRDYAFYNRSALTSIYIPSTVTSIGTYAFNGCSNITSVGDLSGVRDVGTCGFYGCSNLTAVDLPNVETIGNSAFRGCTLLSAVIGPHVTNIGRYNFYENTNTITLQPESLVSVGDYAFYRCSNLTATANFPNLTSIGEWAFTKCPKLTGTMNAPNLVSIGERGMAEAHISGHLYLPSLTTLGDWAFNAGTGNMYITSVDFPLMTYIPNHCFNSNSRLESVSLPSVTTIGNEAFLGCSLTDFDFSHVTSVGYGAFYNTDLTSVSLPLVTDLPGGNPFNNCHSLTSADISNADAFWGFKDCENLTSILIKNGVEISINKGIWGYTEYHKIASFNGHLYWEKRDGTSTSTDESPVVIFRSDATPGEPTMTTVVQAVTSSGNTITDGNYTINFKRTQFGGDKAAKYTITWTTTDEGDETDAVQ